MKTPLEIPVRRTPLVLLLLTALVLTSFSNNTVAQDPDCIRILCPADTTVESLNPRGTYVTYSVEAENLCGDPPPTITCDPPGGSLFRMGATTVTCVATDNVSSTNTCSFTVTVVDTTPPELLCPPDIRVPCSGRRGAEVDFSVAVNDNSDTNLTVAYNPLPGSLFPIGTNVVTATSTDASGNVGRCTFRVIVESGCTVEQECIEIDCPADIVRICETPADRVVEYTASAFNACGRETPVVTFEPPSGSTFPIGESVVIATAVTSSATNRCSFLVSLRDVEPPVLNCPDPIEVDAQGLDGAIVDFSVTATDDCSTNLNVHCSPPPGSVFPVGTTRVLCFVRDESGNEDSCVLPVTVRPPMPMALSRDAEEPGSLQLRWFARATLQESESLLNADWKSVDSSPARDGNERLLELNPDSDNRFYRLIPDPIALPPDGDADGVPDRDDLCPGTPDGQAVDACGCSAVQMVVNPDPVTQPTLKQLEETLMEISGEPVFRTASSTLSDLLFLMDDDANVLQRGEVRNAANRYADRVDALDQLVMEMERLAPAFQREPLGRGDEADVDASDAKQTHHDFLIHRLKAGAERARMTRDCFQHVSDQFDREFTLDTRVSQLDEGGGRLELERGDSMFVGAIYQDLAIPPGAEVSLQGVQFLDGGSVVTSVLAVESEPDSVVGLITVGSVQMRIAPWQQFTSEGPWILHHPEAYNIINNRLYLEQGMRVAAGVFGVESEDTLYYALNIHLFYKSTGGGNKIVTLAPALRVGDLPVAFPGDMDANSFATLIAVKVRYPMPGDSRRSAEPEVVGSNTWTIRVSPRYSFAEAAYTKNVFDLEDAPTGSDHGITEVESVELESPLIYADQAPVFRAEGHTWFGGFSSYPNVLPVSEGSVISIYSHDFFDPSLQPFSEFIHGTDVSAGLRWPRVVGKHNGFEFSYAVKLPELVRDRIGPCGEPITSCLNNADGTYYRLPFKGGWPVWSLSQGNCGSFTHKDGGKYAFDFPAPTGTSVRAARGGEVILVREDEGANCCPLGTGGSCVDDCPFKANVVAIEHQDGTIGIYYHMPQNGVLVKEGEIVRRGDPIAKVGNTGFSTGPHLHFEVRNKLDGVTIPIRFEAWSIQAGPGFYLPVLPIRTCYRPGSGEVLFSTNKRWNE